MLTPLNKNMGRSATMALAMALNLCGVLAFKGGWHYAGSSCRLSTAAPHRRGSVGLDAKVSARVAEAMDVPSAAEAVDEAKAGGGRVLNNIQYGDTGGAALLAKDVLISRGNADILNEIQWQVMPGERWGIVGPNGAGKSTLLAALLGTNPTINVASGSVRIKPGLEVGYLEQTSVGGTETTLQVRRGFHDHRPTRHLRLTTTTAFRWRSCRECGSSSRRRLTWTG